MKTKDDAHATLDEWFESGCVGNLIFYRAPRANMVDAIVEQVVKTHEMSAETRRHFEKFMDLMDIQKGEVFRDREGRPDRVKLTRDY